MKKAWLDRAVGVVIAVVIGAAAVLLWFAVSWTDPEAAEPPAHGLVLGIWDLFYVTSAPSARVLLAAVALALLAAGLIALLEHQATSKARRSLDDTSTPLSARVIMAETRGRYDGPVTVTVMIPAHNEQATLPATLTSLRRQSHSPDRIIVVADNCTDATVALARQHGVEVIESRNNRHKKAGALNQALQLVLPEQGLNDVVMIMDADTTLDDGFLAAAVDAFTRDRALMAVGGLFYGEEGSGILGQLQRNEYIRYSREIRRRRGRVYILTGTASLFRPVALRTVAASRGTRIPGTPGNVYDTAALTEDNELTIALKSLGALMISPRECTVVTEVMPTWRMLWKQRLRWERGALENIGSYGVSLQTVRYWAQQLGLGYSVFAFGLFLVFMALTLLAVDTWIWFPFWLGMGLVFLVERVVTVWHGGRSARLLALSFFPELIFDLVLNVIYVKGIIDITLGRQATWNHVDRGQRSTPEVSNA
ncbi:glycosyltransferase family 2 protein [Salinibacterium sp. dk2585]|uniref:glycosyltransferase n=1 Tax=unclassified Salinibacterium TaxID=2632331 RepID=UPI0011C2540D|nr:MULTISPECIES: glycosyltransferase family 2 protein [unclassified Salinibacterium]QEE61059.1 glycosyltransferase family 2 protein [Salinibacterium sp. dk2585]TXK53001.1 glycosyltransferase family 2 protein [Salinibacterium sp. dk5596]